MREQKRPDDARRPLLEQSCNCVVNIRFDIRKGGPILESSLDAGNTLTSQVHLPVSAVNHHVPPPDINLCEQG